MYFYSAITGGFYDPEFFGNNLPSDACSVSLEEHADLMLASSQGRLVKPDSNGRPMISEAPVLSQAQIESAERAWRDLVLSKACNCRDRHRDEQELFRPTTLSPERFVELLSYIQRLRDWPQSSAFPDVTQRPQAPTWLEQQNL